MKCLIKEQDFEQLAWEYFLKAKSDGVVHAEVFFDPQAHTGRGIAYEIVVKGFTTACQRAEKELQLSAKLILCLLRHLPVEDSTTTYEQARLDLESGRLAGLGLDSSEKEFPPGAWKEIYGTAKTKGIRRTAHAGEEGPVGYIREALNELDIERIDHGIRLAEDTDLMQEVADKNILVTMCPLSNVRLRCVKNVRELPIRTFLDNGVMFSINSDDPAYFGGYILENYCAVQEACNLTAKDWEGITKAAVEGSWCDHSRKTYLLELLNETMVQFGYG